MVAASRGAHHALVLELTEYGAGMKSILAVAMLAAGCASHPVPSLQLEVSAAAIERASGSGGRDGAASLESAREKMDLARRLVADRATEPGRWLAEQAQVDAELAQAKSAAAAAARDAASWRESVRALRAGLVFTDNR